MLQKIVYLFFFLIFSSAFSQQDTLSLSLEECLRIALEQNLDLKRAGLRAETSEVNFKQTRANLLPNLNGRFNAGINNGRSIDPFTNAYIDEQLSFANAGLSLGATVFNGFRIKNSIQRDRFNLKASEMEIEEAKQDLVLNVTLAYLQIQNNLDLVRLANIRLQATQEQIERIRELYDLGRGNPADYTDLQGQFASERTALVRAKNALKASMLDLSQLLNVEYEVIPETEKIPLALEQYERNPEEVFEDALSNLATFKARELRIKAARKNVSVSKSFYFPEISLFGQLNTNYSSAARIFNDTGAVITETGGYVTIENENYPVFISQTQFVGEEIEFYDQFKNNLNSVVGIAVDIPLFNGFRARNNVNLQKIQLEESRVELENTKLQFRQSIEQAHAAMEAAYKQYVIFQDQVEAFSESFRINEIRFNSGVSNVVEYIISKNNLDNAAINLSNAKYEYLLRVKVLEYFRGNI